MAHRGWRLNVLRTPETLLGPYGHINLSFRLDLHLLDHLGELFRSGGRHRSSRANVARPVGGPEAADGSRDDLLGQPQHDVGEIDDECNGEQEDRIDRHGGAQRLRKPHPDELRGHEQDETIRRRDQPEGKGRDEDKGWQLWIRRHDEYDSE